MVEIKFDLKQIVDDYASNGKFIETYLQANSRELYSFQTESIKGGRKVAVLETAYTSRTPPLDILRGKIWSAELDGPVQEKNVKVEQDQLVIRGDEKNIDDFVDSLKKYFN